MPEETPSFRGICEVCCGLVATVEDGRVTKLRPDREHVLSKGFPVAVDAVREHGSR